MKSDRKCAAQTLLRFVLLSLLLGFGLTPCVLPAAQQLTLAWDPVPSPLVAGYKVHYGIRSRSYDKQFDSGTNALARLSDLADGTLYFFAVTAYDVYHNESDYSSEIYYVTPGTNAVSPFVKIVAQPLQQAAALGSNVTLNVTATGGGTLSYQWRKDGKDLPGAISSHLTVNVVDAKDAGRYSVVVKNVLGSKVSYPAALRVIIPPRVESANRLSDGSIRLAIANSDGSAMSPFQVYRFGVEAAADPGPAAAWTPLTNAISFEDGYWVVKDPESANLPQRYYRTVDYGHSTGPIRLRTPERLANGNVRLRARLDAGTRELTPGEAARVQFEATRNPAFPGRWVPLTQATGLTNGEAVVEDDVNANLRLKRFYRAVVRGDGPLDIQLQAAPQRADGVFHLRLGRADGQALTAFDVYNYEVWVKTNLLNDSSWQLLTNPFALSNGKLILHDTGASGSSVRVYRVYAR